MKCTSKWNLSQTHDTDKENSYDPVHVLINMQNIELASVTHAAPSFGTSYLCNIFFKAQHYGAIIFQNQFINKWIIPANTVNVPKNATNGPQ